MQAEAGQLVSELDRIAQTTSFNGQKLLNGSMGMATFQIGANANESIQASGTNFRTNSYGDNRMAANGTSPKDKAGGTNIAAAAIDIAGYLGSATYTTLTTDTAKSIATAINGKTDKTGVTASASTTALVTLGKESYSFDITSDNATAQTVSFSVSAVPTSADDLASAISAINAVSSKTGVTAEYDSANKGLKLTNSSGNDITIKNKVANTKLDVDGYKLDGTPGGTAQTLSVAADSSVVNGRVTFDSQQSFSVADAGSGLNLDTNGLTGATNGASQLQSVSSLDVTTYANAQLGIAIVDAALTAVNGQRAQYGALQSRFSSTISNLATTSENLSASRSRIQDADFAQETANLTRNQILQQAGVAMLAQANALPNQVLSLLK
jgi:flagellin